MYIDLTENENIMHNFPHIKTEKEEKKNNLIQKSENTKEENLKSFNSKSSFFIDFNEEPENTSYW